MDTTSFLLGDWQHFLSQIGTVDELDDSARQYGALTRMREIRTGEVLLRLILAWSVCGLSLRQTAAWAALQDLANLSDQALQLRFKGADRWLQALVNAKLSKLAALVPPPGGYRLRIVDATVLCQPGSKGSDWRVHLSLELGALQIDHVEVTDAKGGETLSRFPFCAGDLALADRGYAHRAGMAAVLAAGADVLVRINAHNLPLEHLDGRRFDLQDAWQRTPDISEFNVRFLGPDGVHWPARVVIQRLPVDIADRNRQRLLKEARKEGRQVNPKTLEAAGYLLLVTTADRLSALDVVSVYRYRWQVELVFKRLKSLLHLDHLPTKDPQVARTWIYAKLLATIVMEQLIRQTAAFSPSARHSRRKRRLAMAVTTLVARQHSHRHLRRSQLAAADDHFQAAHLQAMDQSQETTTTEC